MLGFSEGDYEPFVEGATQTRTIPRHSDRWKVAATIASACTILLAVKLLAPDEDGKLQLGSAVQSRPWYDGIASVKVFSPGDAVQDFSWGLYNGSTRCPDTAEFSSDRYALLLKAGAYADQVALGYYTSLIGVGESPDDVRVHSFYSLTKCCHDPERCGDSLTNFWRSAEGVATAGDVTWAVSQGAPLRRVHIGGTLTLSDHAAAASGGFLAELVVDGELRSGMQQQHLVRNTHVAQGVVGTYMNYVFVGVNASLPTNDNGRISVVETTPRLAAKPYLVEHAGEWSIVVPPIVAAAPKGPLPLDGPRIPMSETFVARMGDDSASINAGMKGKRALLLTPAVYELDAPLVIDGKGFVVLGIGFPTLVTTGGQSALIVAADGVRVGGVLVEAGSSVVAGPTAPLVRWAGNNGVASDVFTRVGAFSYALPSKPSCLRTRADVHVAIEGHAVTLDNAWLWHAGMPIWAANLRVAV